MLGAYLVQPLPVPLYPIDVSGGWSAWEMLGNGPDPSVTDQGPGFQGVGNCGFCGGVHKIMADACLAALANHAAQPAVGTFPNANEVVTEYLAYDGGQDQGVVVSEMIHTWFTQGFFGQKIDGYVPIALNQIDAAMAVFGAIICGVNLTADADQLFSEGQPWTVANGETPSPSEGHVIVKVKSDPELDTYVTWGALQTATKDWSKACVEEAWAPVTLEQAKNRTLNIDALLADIRSIGGGQAIPDPTPAPAPPNPSPPAPVPPTPPHPPVPTPAPSVGVITEIETDAKEAVAEVEELAEDAIHAVES
jgi:hypothetical protein